MNGVKRLFDVAMAALALVALGPLLFVIALAVRLGSPGPVLFRQIRIGRQEMPFTMLKFRSMIVGAPAQGPYYTARGDPRITRVGRVLRRTSLDELPQFVNVLRGDMSLVGPRPDVPEQMALYTDEERRLRHTVRPGITGWAQVRCRNEGGDDLRKALDMEYVRQAGFWFDLKILLMTVRQVLFKGSY